MAVFSFYPCILVLYLNTYEDEHVSVESAISQAPEAIVGFVRELIAEQEHWNGTERRSEKRRSVGLSVRVQPLDDHYQFDGPAFSAVTKNVSGSGIGLIHNAPIDQDFLLVTLQSRDGQTMDLVTNVRHCSYENGMYLIGGRFVVRWD